MPAVELTRIGKLENALANLDTRPVHFIEEENHGVLAGLLEPVRRIPAGAVAGNRGKTKQIAFGHLTRTALDHGQTALVGELINQFGLADSVTAADKDGETCVRDDRSERGEGEEVNRGHGALQEE